MMKGWMDRVFAEGSAYAFEKSTDLGDVPKGLLRTNVAVVFNTSNTEEQRERVVFLRCRLHAVRGLISRNVSCKGVVRLREMYRRGRRGPTLWLRRRS